MNLPKFIVTLDGVFRLGMVYAQYRGLRIVYVYDDDFHEDFNVSDELKIEYYE